MSKNTTVIRDMPKLSLEMRKRQLKLKIKSPIGSTFKKGDKSNLSRITRTVTFREMTDTMRIIFMVPHPMVN